MSMIDILIVIIIVLLFIGAIIYIRKNGTCTENCDSCHGICHAPGRKKGTVPPFVEAYRKDHPKASSHSES